VAAAGEIRDITVIGAGPVGLAAAFWAGMREASVRVVDALPEIGGQLTALYPEKPIYDVPGHPTILARELVARHREQTLEQFDVDLRLGTTAEHVSSADDHLVVHTATGDLPTRTIIVAGGHGAFTPRRLPDLDVSAWEGRGVSYVVGDKASLAGRRVLVVGGGDSACDWALDLVGVAASVGLVHRRERFRAHEATVRRLLAGPVDVLAPYRVGAVLGGERVEAVRLVGASADGGEVEVEVACDELLLQLGFRTTLGPLAEWGFDVERGAIRVDALGRTSLDRVWACGDVATYDGKLKLIATGYAEAAACVAQAVRRLRPGAALQPGHSTDTGVPGAVAGRR
jgi:thioredoxin reductase (NADPH)